ncbi:unnamed protein product [Trifolium pratense]|uniref:Uncharacterized protein n=1 Tax=Trifolium pratense TaxID=57577 RepID=A0ACB0LT70_TRIPR|nr:unnamed protein product [Trifolium pratense]
MNGCGSDESLPSGDSRLCITSWRFKVRVTRIWEVTGYLREWFFLMRFTQTIRGIQGAMIISGSFQMVMGFLGLWRNAVRFLSPLCGVPCVTFTGLGLYHLGFPMLASAVEVGLPALISMVFISQLLTSGTAYNNKPEVTQNSCRNDRAGLISSAPWFAQPK